MQILHREIWLQDDWCNKVGAPHLEHPTKDPFCTINVESTIPSLYRDCIWGLVKQSCTHPNHSKSTWWASFRTGTIVFLAPCGCTTYGTFRGILVCHLVDSQLGTATFQQGATTHDMYYQYYIFYALNSKQGATTTTYFHKFSFIAFNCLWPSGSISTRSNTFIFWGYGLYKMEL